MEINKAFILQALRTPAEIYPEIIMDYCFLHKKDKDKTVALIKLLHTPALIQLLFEIYKKCLKYYITKFEIITINNNGKRIYV